MTQTKSYRLRRADAVATAAQLVLCLLADRLRTAGVPFTIAVTASRRTGSVYIAVRVYGPSGRRLKHSGACVRISDHNQRGSRRANFSRPAKRFYGVWFGTSEQRTARKVERIAAGIARRVLKNREGGDA